MIEVENLSKHYGSSRAIEDLTFDVGRGEIVGFLGPNGAGKTTTMRILTGFLSASSGKARIAGFDIADDAIEVRRRIGYMPENNPLPEDMRVADYLNFRGKLKGLSGRLLRRRRDDVLARCGLDDVRKRVIGHLSKGYRQRVGLADALIHEPDVIILDEPTIGLDPHQIRSVRKLIRELGEAHTILLSTHILSEVEMTCSRVLILHQGSIKASEDLGHIQSLVSNQADPVQVEIMGAPEDIRVSLESIPKVSSVSIHTMDADYQRCVVHPEGDADLRPPIFDLVKSRPEWQLRELKKISQTLEEIFIRVTQQEEH